MGAPGTATNSHLPSHSPSTARLDRVRKLPVYAAAGVAHVWLLDPLQLTLEVFRLDAGRWLLVGAYGDEELVAGAVRGTRAERSGRRTK